MKIVSQNKKAYHEYFVEDTYEAGIELVGTEVKSIRAGQINLRDSFAIIKNSEILLMNTHISPYKQGSYNNVDPTRTRRLLLHKAEINKIRGKVEQKGYTIVPLKIYLKGSLVKAELGICKGKELHDKRRTIKERDEKRNVQRIMKEYNNR